MFGAEYISAAAAVVAALEHGEEAWAGGVVAGGGRRIGLLGSSVSIHGQWPSMAVETMCEIGGPRKCQRARSDKAWTRLSGVRRIASYDITPSLGLTFPRWSRGGLRDPFICWDPPGCAVADM
jgi:hypothetical protein